MNLYRTANGRWVGTQQDAKADGKGWVAIDVPTDKPGMLAWLNEGTHIAPVLNEMRTDSVFAAIAAASPSLTAEDTARVEATPAVPPSAAVDKFIGQANAFQLAGLMESACLRLDQLLEQAKA